MCEDTLISLMIILIVRTPNCFEMKHIEIRVFLKFIYQFYRYLRIRMSKRAKIFIFTFSTCFYI